MLCDVCVAYSNSSENKDLNSLSVGLRAGWMSVGMSSISVLDCLHGVGAFIVDSDHMQGPADCMCRIFPCQL